MNCCMPSFFLHCSVSPSSSLPFHLLPTVPLTFNVSMAMPAEEKIKYPLCISFFFTEIWKDDKEKKKNSITCPPENDARIRTITHYVITKT